ncbi:MAG: hypothetical protein HQL53_08250 [Magnetococcales bacterium]|nr:hypothetical protein [Magnetococcales bacterium]
MSEESGQDPTKQDIQQAPNQTGDSEGPKPRSQKGKWLLFILLFTLGCFMYASIMYKVAKYGP